MKNKFYTFILLFFLSNLLHAQRIIGYFPNYAYTASYTQVQYSKLTHLYYFSLNPDEPSLHATTSNGGLWYGDPYSWFTTANFNNVKAHIAGLTTKPKIIIVSGGAPGSDYNLNARFLDIGTTAWKTNKFCNQIVAFINSNGLDGWDFDWEFPTTTAEKDAHQSIVQKMRTKLDSLELINCKQYEISMAVGGNYTDVPLPAAKICWNPANTDMMNQATINTVDFINLMTYDGATSGYSPASCGNATSHQHYNMMVKGYTDWRNAYTIPVAKINIGVGFYNNPASGGVAFSTGGTGTAYYSQNYWNNGGAGCPVMQTKIDYAKANGNSGLMIWHILQDNLCVGTTPTCNSLLDCIYQYTTANWGTAPASSNPCSMPVDFLHFYANRTEEGVALNWSTVNEKDNHYFSVERSLDGSNFQEVEKVNPKGGSSSNSNSYYVLDQTAISSIIYYRIAQYDLNGTINYSSIVSVSDAFGIKLINNPFSDVLSIKAYSNNDHLKATVSLLDINGKTLETKAITLNETIEMGKDISAGVYTVLLNVNGEIKRYKVIRQ